MFWLKNIIIYIVFVYDFGDHGGRFNSMNAAALLEDT